MNWQEEVVPLDTIHVRSEYTVHSQVEREDGWKDAAFGVCAAPF